MGLFNKIIGRVKNELTKGKVSDIGKIDIIGFYGWVMERTSVEYNPDEKKELGDNVVVNWVIPDLDVGSGGHMNIFRFISLLEARGLHNRIYLYASSRFSNNDEFRAFLNKYYSSTLNNEKIEAFFDVSEMKYAQATVATGWQTAYFVNRFNNTDKKFYFVQDYEPYFYPMGSEFLLAENTYKFGFRGITAGDWLKDKLREEYGMKTDSFGFSYDKELYKPVEKRDNVNRLFFYARPVTARRAFELGLLVLNEVYKQMPDIEVIFAGWDVSNYVIPFKHANAGSVKLEELSDLYGQCDICFLMSTTNLSLLPLEVMASNSVVATSYGKNNEWLLNEDNSILMENEPLKMADTIVYYLKNKHLLEEKRKNGISFANTTSWEDEAAKVYDFILKGIKDSE